MGKLKIVYSICGGMDIHRDLEYQFRRFSSCTGSLYELRNWLLANDCKDVYMKSTWK